MNGKLSALVCCALFPLAAPAAADPIADILPAGLARAVPPGTAANRGWTTKDIVEVTRITDVAVQGRGRITAFLLKQPSIALGNDRYGLYLVDGEGKSEARKLLETSYLADLEWRPGTDRWTVRGDFGEGVQLYEINAAGVPHPLVKVEELARVGGSDGIIFSAVERPRETGVVAYGWAPDGSTLWYTRLRLPSKEARQRLYDRGLVYDDVTVMDVDFHAAPAADKIELRIFDPRTGEDRLAAETSGDRMNSVFAFQHGSVEWSGPDRLVYRLVGLAEDGTRHGKIRTYDLKSGQAGEVPTGDLEEAFGMTALPDSLLTTRPGADGKLHLIQIKRGGGAEIDHGEISYRGIRKAWSDGRHRALLTTRGSDRDGLSAFPASASGKALEAIEDSLSVCDFNSDLSFGACSRESVTGAPELVAVFPQDATLVPLARPNARYDAVRPLRFEPAKWTNRFGNEQTGYVTYPRDYRPGHKYPAIVVTHGSDARNLFAWDGFQWSYPVQLFAERGYFVLSVNEMTRDRAAMNAYSSGDSSLPVTRMQQAMGFDAIATMEAAVQSLIDRNMVDPARIGIAGYSRGAIVTTLVMSHSDMFKVGSNADTNFFNAGGFWMGAMVRELYRGLYGGSPFDPRFFENYRAFSPSARAEHFAGPLLQMHTAAVAPSAVELDQMLKEAGIPTEMVVYLDETHILHRPRTSAAAMEHSFDWFDYWLQGRRDPDADKAEQYRRWDALAAKRRKAE